MTYHVSDEACFLQNRAPGNVRQRLATKVGEHFLQTLKGAAFYLVPERVIASYLVRALSQPSAKMDFPQCLDGQREVPLQHRQSNGDTQIMRSDRICSDELFGNRRHSVLQDKFIEVREFKQIGGGAKVSFQRLPSDTQASSPQWLECLALPVGAEAATPAESAKAPEASSWQNSAQR